MPRYRNATVSLAVLALALAGCNKSAHDMSASTASPSPDSGLPALPAALPMQTGPASQSIAAPPIAALPVRRYVTVARPARDRDAYACLDRASDVQDAIGDAPPDYRYRNDDGVSPWVWQTNGGDRRYAEPSSDGTRYYYYQPGARQPYLVRTHDYSYAYAAGALVAIYALSGALLPHDHYDRYRDEASRYYSRGEELRQYSDERPHEGVVASDWSQRRRQFSEERANWASARDQQPDWRDYHAQNDPSQRPGWQQEHQRRQQATQQFSGWQSRGLAGPPPALLGGGDARGADHRGRPGVLPMPGPTQNYAAQAAAARDQQIAAQQAAQRQDAQRQDAQRQDAQRQDAQRQDLARQRLAQETTRVQQQAAAQRQAAAVRDQQLAARNQAQQQLLASQRAEQDASRVRQQAVAQQQAVVAHEQQLAERNKAQQQMLISQKAEQEASRVRQQAAAQQQMNANVQRQQEQAARAAQAQATARQQAQRREAVATARQAQLQALAAQRQAMAARAQAQTPAARHEPNHPGEVRAKDREQQ